MEKILAHLNKMSENTLMQHLGIEYIYYNEETLTARMPVNSTVHQPMGLLHGGATMALAESVGSALSSIVLHNSGFFSVGMEINGNHVRSIRSGEVYAKATFLHKGLTSHVIEIQIHTPENKLVSVCRMTCALKKYDN